MTPMHIPFHVKLWLWWATGSLILTGCLSAESAMGQASDEALKNQALAVPQITYSPQPTRPIFSPGELVDYTAQPGDTLPALAAHFNTTVREIRQANPFIPEDATTMPPGMPMKIPIYYQALWGSAYQIIPDAHFVNGPSAIGFDTAGFVASHSGWLKNYSSYIAGRNRSGAEMVDFVATYYSISPRLLLALLEYQLGALSEAQPPVDLSAYPLGEHSTALQGLYRQLTWAANALNNGFYGWRNGELKEITLTDGRLERPDPWQNAATVALHYYFSLHLSPADYERAIAPEGLAATFSQLFGDPWTASPHIPGSLRQPPMQLPFEVGKIWAFTGGPHNPWGEGAPLSALDFAPPSVVGGCTSTEEFATAVADGVIARTDTGIAVLDLDGDGDERTGWVVFYLHLSARDLIPQGSIVSAGQPLGHPSCEGGTATGTHVHIARKYNGEWILADGPLAFNLEGWVARNGSAPYLGTLTRQGKLVRACVCSDQSAQLQSLPQR